MTEPPDPGGLELAITTTTTSSEGNPEVGEYAHKCLINGKNQTKRERMIYQRMVHKATMLRDNKTAVEVGDWKKISTGNVLLLGKTSRNTCPKCHHNPPKLDKHDCPKRCVHGFLGCHWVNGHLSLYAEILEQVQADENAEEQKKLEDAQKEDGTKGRRNGVKNGTIDIVANVNSSREILSKTHAKGSAATPEEKNAALMTLSDALRCHITPPPKAADFPVVPALQSATNPATGEENTILLDGSEDNRSLKQERKYSVDDERRYTTPLPKRQKFKNSTEEELFHEQRKAGIREFRNKMAPIMGLIAESNLDLPTVIEYLIRKDKEMLE